MLLSSPAPPLLATTHTKIEQNAINHATEIAKRTINACSKKIPQYKIRGNTIR